MKDSYLESRVIDEAEWMIKNKATVRSTAKKFGTSKSRVYSDITKKLKEFNQELYQEAIGLLASNKKDRAMRGGLATKARWLKLKKKV